MKGNFIFLLCFLLAISSCKKNNDQKPSSPSIALDSTLDFAFGDVLASPQELQKIKPYTFEDTNRLSIFGIGGSIDSFTLSNIPDPGNQGRSNSCAGWAVGYGLLSIQYRQIEENPTLLISPSFVYNSLNGMHDEGISTLAALQFLVDSGSCNYSIMGDVPYNAPIPAGASDDASGHIISDFETISVSNIALMKSALKKDIPVVISIRPDSSFEFCPANGPNAKKLCSDQGAVVVDSTYGMIWKRSGQPFHDNHAMLIVGYNDAIHAFLFLNSWGPKYWGNKGRIWVDYDLAAQIANYAFVAFPRSVITKKPLNIGKTTATVTGAINNTNALGGNITERGLYYSLTDNKPSANDAKIQDAGTGIGTFTENLGKLNAGSQYFVRAYAKSNTQISYGNVVTLMTLNATLPVVTTVVAGNIDSNSATIGGIINDDGGADITSKGFVFGQSSSLADGVNYDAGNNNNTFLTTISNLKPGATYYYKAYAVNSVGRTDGNIVNFQTTGNISLSGSYAGYIHFTYDSIYNSASGWQYVDLDTVSPSYLSLSNVTVTGSVMSGTILDNTNSYPFTGSISGNIVHIDLSSLGSALNQNLSLTNYVLTLDLTISSDGKTMDGPAYQSGSFNNAGVYSSFIERGVGHFQAQ